MMWIVTKDEHGFAEKYDIVLLLIIVFMEMFSSVQNMNYMTRKIDIDICLIYNEETLR